MQARMKELGSSVPPRASQVVLQSPLSWDGECQRSISECLKRTSGAASGASTRLTSSRAHRPPKVNCSCRTGSSTNKLTLAPPPRFIFPRAALVTVA